MVFKVFEDQAIPCTTAPSKLFSDVEPIFSVTFATDMAILLVIVNSFSKQTTHVPSHLSCHPQLALLFGAAAELKPPRLRNGRSKIANLLRAARIDAKVRVLAHSIRM